MLAPAKASSLAREGNGSLIKVVSPAQAARKVSSTPASPSTPAAKALGTVESESQGTTKPWTRLCSESETGRGSDPDHFLHIY